MSLYGKDLICTQDWSKEELVKVLDLALEMKRERFNPRWNEIIHNKSFLMLFYSPSVRTHLSFETAATELGGHAVFLTPEMTRFSSVEQGGESIEDVAKVMSRYMAGIGIRLMEDKVPYYGAGTQAIREYAKWATVPVINMADDRFHPCQGLADIMGWAEWYGNGPGKPNFANLKGKKLLLTWAKGMLARTWCSVHESMLIASRFGMNVTVARPDDYDLDPEVYDLVRQNCKMHNTQFEIINDAESGYEGAHVVLSRNWISPKAYESGKMNKTAEIEKALRQSDWITTAERMARTDNAIFSHPMPVDRNNEVTDEVASGPRSAIYDIAENRLHVQKAIMALTMGQVND
ncbi:MAG: ornithine carbamoyltransferase [Coxiellaceae bacterium]|nr:MAG: ornithine carbamoyltransferase [Coxiellaceae bacterium]